MTTESGKRITQLSPEQLDLLRRRLAQAGQSGATKLPRRAPSEGGAVPLSFAQERVWYRDYLNPGGGSYNITVALRLEGTLSTTALSATLDEILRRHEALRANFTAPSGEPLQTISAPSSLPVESVDLSGLDAERREAEARRRHAEEIRRGFDLSSEHPLRATLVRLGPQEHMLLLAMHHIASDGWSIGLLLEELSALYTAFAESKEPSLPEPPVQYGDFAAWQRQRAAAGALDEGLAYWRRQLDNPPPILRPRPSRGERGGPRPHEGYVEGATSCLRVEEGLKKRLDELSRREDTTLFTTLLASFMSLLMRCTGEQDIVIGSPVSGRTRVETERLIGLFLNTVALRARLSPEQTFRQALAAVRRAVLEGLAHHEVPFERVVQELDPERRSSGHPLFDILFNFTPSPPRRIELPGLRARYEEPPVTGAEFSTQLFITEAEGALEIRLVYPVERYTEAHMACFLEQLHAVLEQVVADPERSLESLDLATPRSRALLPDPTVTLAEPAHPTVPRSIAAWVERTPERTAVCQRGTALTYADFGERMLAVAERLHSAGLRPGDVVAVSGARSPGVVVCMAGVLLSGGVLLTLSPDLPEQRRRVMLEEANARLLLRVGGRSDDDWLRRVQGLEVVGVETDGALTAAPADLSHDAPAADGRSLAQRFAEALSVVESQGEGRRPAYVFFTSGSTGKPKGVLGAHAGLAHFLDWQRETFEVGPGDRCGQLTGLSFDVVLRDVFLPLTSGATLVLPADEETASGEQTLRWLEREAVSLLHTVPAVVEMWLLKVPADVTLASLRRVFFAGEPLTAALVGRFRLAFPRAGEIVNLYGPTETTLAKCFYRVPTQPREGIQPLGVTLPQTQALVLTPRRALCGVGEPGEIAIRTPFRSLGYLNAPEENERRFVVNPFGGASEDRLYLTGDRGVYASGGVLEFLGRLDEQVKVRGVRVDPAEVATTLRSCAEVAACAVVAREDVREGTALVAYVVPSKGAGENAARLQEFLRQRLPAAMVPSAFVFLEALPLTPNGKLDRERLPAPDGVRPKTGTVYVAPRDAKELQLAQVWEEMLNVRPVGVKDNFFEIGGHSLMALRMLMQVEQRLGKKVPLAALLERATIEHLAAFTRRNEDGWPPVVSLWAAPHRLKLFLVHPGGGTALNYVHLVRHLAAEVPVYGLQARGLDGRDEPHRSIEQMAAAYVEEVRRLQPEGPYLLAGHSLGGVIAFEMARQLQERGQHVGLLALFDSSLTQPDAEEAPAAHERERDARALADMAAAIEGFAGREVGVTYEELRALSADEQVEHVVAALKRSDALPFGLDAEATRNMLNVNRAHVAARRDYRPKVSPVPVTLFRASDARAGDGVAGESNGAGGEDLGWGAVSAGTVRVIRAPGDHLTMMAEPHVGSLAEALRPCLDAATRS